MAGTKLGDSITVNLKVDATTTAAIWRTWAQEGNRFVKLSYASADKPNATNGLLTAEAIAENDADFLGVLTSTSGGDNELVGTVLTRALDITVKGPDTAMNAIPDSAFAKGWGVKANAANEVIPNGGAGGFGQVIGGTGVRIRVAFQADIYRGA